MEFKIHDKVYFCPVELTLDTIGGKWKVLIIWQLLHGMKRYGELRKLLPKVTHKMLTQQLRELEEDKIIERKVYAVVPPKVEYSLAKRGHELAPVLDTMAQWADGYKVVVVEQGAEV